MVPDRPGLTPEMSARLDSAFRFGGDEASVRREQQPMIRHFAGCQRVLDIGCGRGIMLDLLKEAGIGAEGVDVLPEAVSYCAAKGHRVQLGDAVTFLEDKRDAYDGIFCSHVVEHLEFERAEQLLHRCGNALRPGGVIVVVTPNSRDIAVMGEIFWLDPTHRRPVPGELLEAVLREQGFVSISLERPPVRPVRLGQWPGWLVRKLALGRYFGSLNLIAVARLPQADHRPSE